MMNDYSLEDIKDDSLNLSQAKLILRLIHNMILVPRGEVIVDCEDVKTFSGTLVREANPRTIIIKSDYYIGRYPITREEWSAVMGKDNDSSKYKVEDENLPVYNVTYDDCLRFIVKLNRITGLNFSLPTSDQWDFAAHGGNNGTYSFQGKSKNDIYQLAWFETEEPMPVGVRPPNPLGLYDMFGNVGELCVKEESWDIIKGGNIVSLKCDDSPYTYHWEDYWTENEREKKYGYVVKLPNGLRLALATE
jgi:formylglycine-generating enzyme required for sulfatase activity